MSKKIKRIYLSSFDQPSLLGNLSYLPMDPLHHKQVERLRAYTGIEKLISKDDSDFDQALKIAKFTSEAWVHNGLSSKPKRYDALTILKMAEKGSSFGCVQFASVFVQLCQSVGIPARVLNVRTKNLDLGLSGHGHVTAEYFDNQLCKWVWVDPQVHAYAIYKNTPLSFNEHAELIVAGKKPIIKFTERTLAYVNNNRAHFKALKNFERRFIWSSKVGGVHSFYTKQTGLINIGCKRKGVLTAITHHGFADKSPIDLPREIFDAPLNGCQIQFETKKPKKTVELKELKDYKERSYLNFAINQITLTLSHSTPWFDHYIIFINGKKKILKDHQFTFRLIEGLNTVRIQTVNAYKRLGPITLANIQYDNRYKEVKNYWWS